MHSAGTESKEEELFLSIFVSHLVLKYIFAKTHYIYRQMSVIYQLLLEPQNSASISLLYVPLNWPSPHFQSCYVSDSPHIPVNCPSHANHTTDIFSLKPIGRTSDLFSPFVHKELVCSVHLGLPSLDLSAEWLSEAIIMAH